MKNKTVSFILVAFALFTQAQTLTTDQLGEDYHLFKSSIQEIHPGLYWYADSMEIERRFQKIASSINEPMELREFYTRLQLFYASIGCGHSWMSMPWSWRKELDEGPYRIPINFFLENDKILTFRNLTDNLIIEGGLEVKSINGISSDRLLDSLKQMTPTDGFIQTRRIEILSGNFSRYYQAVFGMDSVFNLVLSDGSVEREINVKGLTNEEANERHEENYGHLKRERKPYLYFENMDEVGYLKIGTFDNESIKNGDQNYKRFLKETFSRLKAENTEKLIIDLRGNSGGEDSFGATLARYLLDEEFDYYKRMEAVTDKFRYNKYSPQRGFNTIAILLKKDKEKPGTF
ncbi:MAG: S41 family peptidase, partial [Bacteroidota bacterium]